MLFENFFEALINYTFLQRALVTSIIVGVICGLVGVFIILRGLIFMGAGIAHSSFAGGALGILLGINPFITIFLFSTGAAMTIGFINEKGYVEDNNVAVGVIFSLMMALAILFISLINSYNANVIAILFGNVLVVTTEDMILLILISIIIFMIIFFMKKELFFITFDDEMAKATGLPVRFITYMLLILISLAIVVSLKAIGAILVLAMITTPAAAAYQWSYKLNRILILSMTFGAISSFIGLYLSYLLNLPSGSTITITVSVIFVISMIFSPKRRARKDIGYKHMCKVCDKASVEECEFCLEEQKKISIHD
ncbi:MAG: metal ABC transporter permease [Candidatus Lokiarchaeota archaeon]